MALDQKIRMRGEKDKFFSSVEDFGYCETAILRTVLVKTSLGRWVCIGIFGIFTPGLTPTLPTTIFESEHVVIEEEVLSLEAIKEFFETLITTDTVESKNGLVRYGGSKFGLADLRLYSTSPLLRHTTKEDESLGSLFLYGFAQDEENLYDWLQIASELLAGKEPYNSLEDLILEKTGEHLAFPFPFADTSFQSYSTARIVGRPLMPSAPPANLRRTSVVIRAPILMKLDCFFGGEEVVLTLKTHVKTNLSKFRLSAIVRGQAEYPALKRVSLPLVNPEPSEDGFVTVTHRLAARDATSAQVFLFRGKDNSLMDFRDFYKSNTVKSIVHRHLDPEYGILEAWLRGNGKEKSDDFEWGVSLLLSLLGFSTEWVGSDFERAAVAVAKKPLGVDVIAHAPDESTVIICSCTVKDPSEKTSQLMLTVNELRNKLGSGAADILPAVFTTNDENNMKEEVERLRDDGIAVVGAQGIKNLLQHLMRGSRPQDVVGQVFRPLLQKPFLATQLFSAWPNPGH